MLTGANGMEPTGRSPPVDAGNARNTRGTGPWHVSHADVMNLFTQAASGCARMLLRMAWDRAPVAPYGPIRGGPHFCSMKISQDVRDYAAEHGVAEAEALQAGMAQKAEQFRTEGAHVYRQG